MSDDRQLYIPQDIGSILDKLGWMMLHSPVFIDTSGYFPDINMETTFASLNEGLKIVREQIGEDAYTRAVSLSDRMRAHFEADPEDMTDDSLAGRALIHEMEDLLKASRKGRWRAPA